MTEAEPKVSNLTASLQGDDGNHAGRRPVYGTAEVKSKIGGALTVRYYCDNLSSERRKYSEVNQ